MTTLHKILACVHKPEYNSILDRGLLYKLLVNDTANAKLISVFYEKEEDADYALAHLWSQYATKRNGNQCECEGFTVKFTVVGFACPPVMDFDVLDLEDINDEVRAKYQDKRRRLLPELSLLMVGRAFEPSAYLKKMTTLYMKDGWTVCDAHGTPLTFRPLSLTGASLEDARVWSCIPTPAHVPAPAKQKKVTITVGDAAFTMDFKKEINEKELVAALALLVKQVVL